jgi:NAD(P)H-quinone oxidoreductase subunit 5
MTAVLAMGVLAAPAAFGAIALVALGGRDTSVRRVERLGVVASWFGVSVAVVAAGATALHGLSESPTLGVSGLGVSVRLDALSTVMLLMITLLAVVIFRFSCTYLDGDERQGVFLGWLAATIAAVEVFVVSGNLFVLVGAWVATSLALHELLVFYRHRPRAVIAARKKFIAARTGDALLITAAVLLYRQYDTGNLEKIFAGIRDTAKAGWSLDAVGVAALCLALAALLKSAQFPTHGWLVEVMDTPTPVSALLHAGILNAGPFLALRMAFVLNDAHLASSLLIVVGGFTALFASVVLLTQPSVKVALGYSSAAHMGFMLMICGIGVFPAALLHLVAHSFYKAHAFLSSGSVIDDGRADKVAIPRRIGSGWRVAASLAVAVGLYLVVAAVWRPNIAGDPVVLVIGVILILGTTQLVAPALDSTGGMPGTARAALLALAVTTSFFTLESAAHHILAGTVPEGGTRTALELALVATVVAAFATVVVLQIFEPARPKSRRRRALAIHLRNGLYANAMYDRFVGALRLSTPRAEQI